jgi:hypothetical protein
MDAPARERPRAVTVIGWTWLVIALLRLGNGLLGCFVWHFGGLDQGIPFLPLDSFKAARALGADEVLRHGSTIFAIQIVVASSVAYLAWSLLRMKPWARRVMIAVACLGVLATLAISAFVAAVTLAAAREAISGAAEARVAGLAAAGVIGIVGLLLFGGTIYLLRRADVRAAFGTRAA